MPIPLAQVGTICVASVHDEEDPIHFAIPGVTPSRYDIPGINAPKEAFESCTFTFPNAKKVKYAVRRTIQNHPYVLVKIVEPHSFVYGTEQQKLDEYGVKLSPDIQRIPVPVRMEAVANEIERQCGQMGLEAFQGDVTLELITRLEQRSIKFMRDTVLDTNKLSRRSMANVTSQARRRAWRLHKMGLLTPLPLWAEVNPDADSNALNIFNCHNCGAQLRKETVRCTTPGCGVIYNWKAAVEDGLVKPSDVPPSKRAEAGLESESENVEVKAKNPVPVETDDDAIASLNASEIEEPENPVPEEEVEEVESENV